MKAYWMFSDSKKAGWGVKVPFPAFLFITYIALGF